MPSPVTMTRQEMAEAVERVSSEGFDALFDANSCELRTEAVTEDDFAACNAAAAELRKSCAGCRYFGDRSVPVFDDGDSTTAIWCGVLHFIVPADGSGFCHEFTPKGAQP